MYLKGPWAISSVLTVASYIYILLTASTPTLYALIAFNLCASTWAPFLLFESKDRFEPALIGTSLTALASFGVGATIILDDYTNGVLLLCGAWLIVHHVLFDVVLYQ